MSLFDLPEGTEEDESVLKVANTRIYKQAWFKMPPAPWTAPPVLHRRRGPAVIFLGGKEQWWRKGFPYTPTAHELMMWELRKKNECS